MPSAYRDSLAKNHDGDEASQMRNIEAGGVVIRHLAPETLHYSTRGSRWPSLTSSSELVRQKLIMMGDLKQLQPIVSSTIS